MADLTVALNIGFREEPFGFRAIEARMYAGEIVECLRNPHPARQDGDIGDKADVAHQALALRPWIAPQHSQLALIRREAEDRIERGGLPCPVGTDKSENAPLLDPQVDAVKGYRCAERFAEAACFYACHGFSVPPS